MSADTQTTACSNCSHDKWITRQWSDGSEGTRCARCNCERVVSDTTKAHKVLTLKSSFALLDVKQGRKTLFKALGYAGRTEATPIPVMITGFIVGAWGDDDGESREFEIDVSEVKVT